MTATRDHHFQIDNQTGSLCCDAWLGEPVDEHGRLLKAPPGHRYEEVDALATDERGYRIYRIDSDEARIRYIVDRCDPDPVLQHGQLIGSVRIVRLDG
jgi:hypothetical protein